MAEGVLLTRSHRFPIAPATVIRYQPERVTVTIETSRKVVLVLGDLFHPFWTATLDGVPVEIFPALHLFRGVRIPAGHHEVDFKCRVPGQPLAVSLSLLAVAAIAAAVSGPAVPRLLAFALILGFSSYFTKDIVSLRKVLLHPDFYTTYYPFRHWFTTRLAAGHFPLWNPSWGIGEAADVWATIPLDLYTPLELAFGPRYHLFHSFQALLLLAATLYGFTRLGFSPLLSAAAAILFFLTPHVTFFYFYFIVTHSYIAHVLLFTFVVLWFRTGRRRYRFLITWTTIFSMLGTKLEFWFFQTVYFVFLAFAGSVVFHRGRLYKTLSSASVPCALMALGVAAHAWQLNILIRLMAESGRAVNSGLVNLISTSLYRNLALSLYESVFLKLALLAVLLLLALRTRGPKAYSYSLVALAGILSVFFLYQDRLTFKPDPALKNGGLESWTRAGDHTLPEHFSFESDSTGDLTRVKIPGDVRSGASALFMAVPSTGETRLRYALPDVSSYRGREVRLTVWSRSERPAPGSFKAVIEDGYGPPSTAILPGRDIWARTRLSHYVDAEARTLSITIAVNSTAPVGVFIDDSAWNVPPGSFARRRVATAPCVASSSHSHPVRCSFERSSGSRSRWAYPGTRHGGTMLPNRSSSSPSCITTAARRMATSGRSTTLSLPLPLSRSPSVPASGSDAASCDGTRSPS